MTANQSTRPKAVRVDLPTLDDDSATYWEGFSRGEFLLAHCADCEHVHHYPRPVCPFCWSDRVTPKPSTGRATLYSYSTVYVNDLAPFRDRLPYIAALVELAEGPRVMTTIVEAHPDELRVGMALEVTFTDLDDNLSVPVFRPAAAH